MFAVTKICLVFFLLVQTPSTFLEKVTATLLDESCFNVFTPDFSDDIFEVRRELTPVATKWRSIGIALRLNPHILNTVQADNDDSKAFVARTGNVSLHGVVPPYHR